MKNRIGFMQGRLSPMVNGKIQAFPWEFWKDEFPVAHKLGLSIMEWTLDHERLYENPFMTKEGQVEILKLCKEYNLQIPSLTGDCFMQSPFYKIGIEKETLLIDFENIVNACHLLGVTYIVFPLVDGGALTNSEEESVLLEELLNRVNFLKQKKVKIIFESDFSPLRLKEFISKFPSDVFGINYDSGNSASLGFSPIAEFKAYGDRIFNVHIKDRVFGGTTVPLGNGDVDFQAVFEGLRSIAYKGNFILQTARSQNDQHSEFISKFSNFVLERTQQWI